MAEFTSRIKDKIQKLGKWIDDFNKIIPNNFKSYSNNNLIIAACERYTERIIEEMIGIANVILKEEGIQDRDKGFSILSQLGLITKELSEKLEQAKGMRNIMVHQYDTFDEQVFFESMKELIKDSKEYIKSINKIKK